MVGKIQVVYGYSVGYVQINSLFNHISDVAKEYKVDFDLRVTRNSITASVYPFKSAGAKTISETDGADILRSLIYHFEHFIKNGILWSVDMATELPF